MLEPAKQANQKQLDDTRATSNGLQLIYEKLCRAPIYKWLVLLLGIPIVVWIYGLYLIKRRDDPYAEVYEKVKGQLEVEGIYEQLVSKYTAQINQKNRFFQEKVNSANVAKEATRWADENYREIINAEVDRQLRSTAKQRVTFDHVFTELLGKRMFVLLTFVPGVFMYLLMYVFGNPYQKFIVERLAMSVFVVLGVAFFVFTILYLSPFQPAANILGESATPEQIAAFNRLYGLDQPYFVQLWSALKGIVTFDLGTSFTGNENVADSIFRRFPITMVLAVISLLMAIMIAIPIGIIAATKPNSFFDYTFMFIALIGLSIPNFWQGLIFILNFSIKLQWLPATFSPTNWLSIIMPAVVLGTALTASIARMTRSSTLEIIHEDYMLTAKAKGLSKQQVLWKHGVRNAMIPIITVIGLLFGGMLGGAAVTEKVFNISGIGSFIVDKQFIPDIPSVMGGVVYIAITISLVNLLIDVLYAFFDPRIRTKMKHY
ncbi:ABC transporter permease [Sutcliffiella horikoshii]|uniref:ABC transporter permease n=1 Tax=Sutcliffiella horikoshii TaxID=79883 RepID=UPI00384B423D